MSVNIKAILKSIGIIAEDVAANAVPGGQAVDTAVHEVIAAKNPTDREKAIIDSVNAGLGEVETFDPSLIYNKDLFNQGVLDAHKAFDEIKQAITKPAA